LRLLTNYKNNFNSKKVFGNISTIFAIALLLEIMQIRQFSHKRRALRSSRGQPDFRNHRLLRVQFKAPFGPGYPPCSWRHCQQTNFAGDWCLRVAVRGGWAWPAKSERVALKTNGYSSEEPRNIIQVQKRRCEWPSVPSIVASKTQSRHPCAEKKYGAGHR